MFDQTFVDRWQRRIDRWIRKGEQEGIDDTPEFLEWLEHLQQKRVEWLHRNNHPEASDRDFALEN